MAKNDDPAAAGAGPTQPAPDADPNGLAADVAAAEVAALKSRIAELEAAKARIGDDLVLRDRQIAALEANLEMVTPPPKGTRFAAPYGFIDAHGERHHWNTGDEVTNEDEIAALQARGAPLETF